MTTPLIVAFYFLINCNVVPHGSVGRLSILRVQYRTDWVAGGVWTTRLLERHNDTVNAENIAGHTQRIAAWFSQGQTGLNQLVKVLDATR